MNTFSFSVTARRELARAGEFVTPHGRVETPIFMPVGTQASVKALDTADLDWLQASIILGNTYHLYLRPGLDVLRSQGGLHQFMNWNKPMLTDSGGFQVFSLKNAGGKNLAHVSEDGVTFRSHHDGSEHFFSPTQAIEIQQTIGADIIMAFDEALSDSYSEAEARVSVERTHRWAEQSVSAWEVANKKSVYGKYQALFGIIQGGLFKDLRQQSAQFISSLPFDGIAIGGETIGYNMQATVEVLDWVREHIPQEKPYYTMGLGRDPQDIVDAVLAGADMFDCVGPTRLARNGAVYHGQLTLVEGQPQFLSEFKNGRISIGAGVYAQDEQPIQFGCDCYTCLSGYSRSYLHHLYKAKELSYYRLASIHNLRTMIRLTEQLRNWIKTGQIQ